MGATKNMDNDHDPIENAEEIIERFGGIRPMASKMDVPVTTVQGWKKRNVIPGNRVDEVMEAAETNNIDLSDVIGHEANENIFEEKDTEAEKSFDSEIKAARDREDDDILDLHKEAVLMAERRTEEKKTETKSAVPPKSKSNNEEMFDQIRAAQSVTFNKSMLFTIGFVSFVVIVAAIALWPSKDKIERNAQQIEAMKGEVAQVREKTGFLGALIPEDLKARLSSMQEQAQEYQATVSTLNTEVETIKNDLLDPNATMNQKLQKVEEHAARLGAPLALTNMLQKVKEMQQSVEGQTQLSGAIAELNMIFQQHQQSDEGQLEQALIEAQQENDTLGQALEGVPQQDLKAAAMLLTLSQLRSSLNRNNTPFEEDLALMQQMLGERDPDLSAAIDKLAPKAESGVLTPTGLKDEFKGLAGDIVVASLKGEDVSVQERARARFNDVLSVEKDGELITGTDTQAKVARAQKMLDEGNIEGAIAELKGLEGDAAVTAQPFMQNAEMTLMAEKLQGMLTKKALGTIGGSGMSFSMDKAGQGVNQLVREIKNMAPERRMISDEASGIRILAPKLDIAE